MVDALTSPAVTACHPQSPSNQQRERGTANLHTPPHAGMVGHHHLHHTDSLTGHTCNGGHDTRGQEEHPSATGTPRWLRPQQLLTTHHTHRSM
jgi:hypothetical protein